MKKGDLLFRIDPAPFEYKVAGLRAQVVSAEQKAKQLKANVDAATADLNAVSAQLAFEKRRRDDFAQLAKSNTASEFRVQDQQKLVDTLTANLSAAQAKQTSAAFALAAQVDGVHVEVVRAKAELGDAQWELDQTSVRAPADGYVTNVALREGARATSQAPAMAFIDTSGTIIGVEIQQIDARYIVPGQTVEATFKFLPGQILRGHVEAVLQAIASGQAQSGGLAVNPTNIQALPLVVRVKLDDEGIAKQLPAGGIGVAAIFTDRVIPSHVIRQVLLRQFAILNYINPF